MSVWETCTKEIGRDRSGWRRHLPPISRPAPAAYIWLSYSVLFFIEPIFRHSLKYWLECLGIFAVFLVMYVCLDIIESRAVKVGILGGFVVLGMVTLPFNSGAQTFFLYGSSMLPFLVSSIPIVTWLVVLDFLLLVGEGVLLHKSFWDYAVAAFFLLAGAGTNIFIAKQRRMGFKLQMAQEQIEQLAAVAERERIARDLHDVLGHTLSVIVLKAELAGRLMGRDPQRAAVEIADVESTARTALAEVREAIGGYRAKGLGAELQAARRTLDAAGVKLVCEAMPSEQALRATEETVLSLVVREAVTNIVRHAEATVCRMELQTSDGVHLLLVEDDGRHMVKHEGNGLRGMRERVQALGGRFSLESNWESRRGTRLRIELPVTLEQEG